MALGGGGLVVQVITVRHRTDAVSDLAALAESGQQRRNVPPYSFLQNSTGTYQPHEAGSNPNSK